MSKSLALPGMQPAAEGVAPRVAIRPAEERTLKLQHELELAMTSLYQAIMAKFPQEASRVIQFVGTDPEAGGSELVRQFALVLACHLDHSVLLVDALARRPAQGAYFKVNALRAEEAAVFGAADCLIETVGRTRLSVCRFPLGVDSLAGVRHEEWLEKFLADSREAFQFVLIDMPGASPRAGCLSRLPQVDGIVLVAEAGRTRWQALRRVQEALTGQGSQILGVMLNKMRYPIPRFIYDRV